MDWKPAPGAAGLDRLLLGVAMSEEDERLFGATLPFGDISSGEIDLVGRLTELVERLTVALDELRGPQTPHRWVAALAAGTERLALPPPGEAWQSDQLHQALDDLYDEPGPAGGGTESELDLAEARALLADRLRGRPTRANFRTGDMTICTLVPMRSVPHRVVCLLGLDDGLFPRPGAEDGDDLLRATALVGDQDIPSEDRQLLLDALLAATEHLVITFEGRDQHLNQRRPPAVPVSELLDVVDKTVRLEDKDRPARHTVVVHHPLQPFDPRNFRPGELGAPGPWRFDAAHLEGARAMSAARHGPPAFLRERLPPLPGPSIQLTSLVRFMEHPVRAFLRERLGLYAGDVPEQLRDALPVELGPLERWALGDRLLDARLAGVSMDRAMSAERGRGFLPPGALGGAALNEVRVVVEALVAELEGLPCAQGGRRSRGHRGHPARRYVAGRHGTRRPREHCRTLHLLEVAPQAPAESVGPFPGHQRSPPRAGSLRHHDRAGRREQRRQTPGQRRDTWPLGARGGPAPAGRPGAVGGPRRPVPTGYAGAAAHLLLHVGGLGGGQPCKPAPARAGPGSMGI